MYYDNYGGYDASTCDECEFLLSECVCECAECGKPHDECEYEGECV